jgi:hypothetical protein
LRLIATLGESPSIIPTVGEKAKENFNQPDGERPVFRRYQ